MIREMVMFVHLVNVQVYDAYKDKDMDAKNGERCLEEGVFNTSS